MNKNKTTVGQTGAQPQGSFLVPNRNISINSRMPFLQKEQGYATAFMKKFSYLTFTLFLAFWGNVQIASAQCDGFVNPNFDNVSALQRMEPVIVLLGGIQMDLGTLELALLGPRAL